MKYQITTNQRAFVYKDGVLENILEDGIHKISGIFVKYEVDTIYVNVNNTKFTGEEKEILLSKHQSLAEQYFYIFDLLDSEIWVIYKDKNAIAVIKGGEKYLYWKGFWTYTCKKIDIKEKPMIDMKEFPEIRKLLNVSSGIAHYHFIAAHEKAIVEINGKTREVLESGEYMFSNIFHTVSMKKYDTRLQTLDISWQEILTKDKISIRLNVSVNFNITDIELFHSKYSQGYDFIYQKTQFIIRELASGKILDELLESKNEVSQELSKKLISTLDNSGLIVDFVGIKDVILPGDMREIMNKVIEAEKKSQIKIIERRDETATTRAMLNTAKSLENNPLLLRLKELETLEKVIDKVGTLHLSNGIDGLLKDFVKLSDK